MTRTVTSTASVWAPQYSILTPHDYETAGGHQLVPHLVYWHPDAETFGTGCTRVGTAEITLTIADTDDLVANKVQALQAEKTQVLADAQAKATRLESQIQQLLAITHEAA